MKKISVVAIILIFVGFNTFAQLSQGMISVGGSLNLTLSNHKNTQNSTTVNGPSKSQFLISPSIEYFLSDRFSLGGGLSYYTSNEKDYPTDNHLSEKASIFSITPFARMYFSMGEKVSLFGQGSIGFGFGKYTSAYKYGNTITSTESKMTNFELGVRPGFQYLVSGKLALEATFGFVGFTSNKSNNKEFTDSSFQIDFSPATLALGIRFFL